MKGGFGDLKTLNTNIAKIRDKNNNWSSIPALKGESAYELAVKKGFEGSEDDFNNSLVKKEEIDKINETFKKEIAAKVGYSEVVDNQLLMYADDTKEKLLATMELPSGVEDVQINGTSIVENGIANIPAYWSNTANGIEFLNTKTKKIQLRLVNPSKKDISNRQAGIYQAINTLNYDYTVKSAMSAPIADTAGMIEGVYHYPAWMSDEQERARERMGVISEDDFELITTVNPSKEEIVSSISIDLAEPIKANFYIVCDIGIIDGSLNYVNIPKIELAINDYYTWMYQSLQKSSTELRYMLMQIPICKKSGLVILSNNIPINNNFQSNVNISGNGLGIAPYSDRNYSRGITKIKIRAKDNYSEGYFSKNTVFAIYGKRI